MWRPEPDNITCTLEGVDAILDWHWKAPDDAYYDQDGSYPRPEPSVLEATRAVATVILDGIEDEVDITTDVLGGMAIYFGDDYIGIMNDRRYHICKRVFEVGSEFIYYDELEDLLKGLAHEYRDTRRL